MNRLFWWQNTDYVEGTSTRHFEAILQSMIVHQQMYVSIITRYLGFRLSFVSGWQTCSSQLNPIGGISKTDLKRFILWASTNFEMPILQSFIDAPPTAELEPITHEYTQSDEQDMGMTYNELSIYGRLRKNAKLGPYSMWWANLVINRQPSFGVSVTDKKNTQDCPTPWMGEWDESQADLWKSKVVHLVLPNQPPQDDNFNTKLPCRAIQPRR